MWYHMFMSNIITKQNGKTRKVQDLGWLLRASKRIEQFVVTKGAKIVAPPWAPCSPQTEDFECKLQAIMKEGDKVALFTSEFASLSLCRIWLNRPRFFTIPLVVDGVHVGPISTDQTKLLR